MSYQYEDIADEVTGALVKWVRVLDEQDWVMRFEQFVQNEAKHDRVVHDGSLTLDKDEVRNNVAAIANQKFRNKAHAKALTVAELPGHKRKSDGGEGASSSKEVEEDRLK